MPNPDGWEMDLQVNVLSTSLLMILFFQWMREHKVEGKNHRIGLVGSGAHINVVDILKDKNFPLQGGALAFFNQEENYVDGRQFYGITKLLLQYAMTAMAKLAVDKNGE